MPNDSNLRKKAPALHRRRHPHIWSWCPLPRPQTTRQCSLHSLAVKLLGLLVEWSALLDGCEALDVQRLTGLLNCCDPRAENRLGMGAGLLAHNLASLCLLECGGSVPRLGLAH